MKTSSLLLRHAVWHGDVPALWHENIDPRVTLVGNISTGVVSIKERGHMTREEPRHFPYRGSIRGDLIVVLIDH
jgi:hypothetical protein